MSCGAEIWEGIETEYGVREREGAELPIRHDGKEYIDADGRRRAVEK